MRTSTFSSTLCGDKIVIGHFRSLVEKSRTDAVTVQILFCTKSRKNSFRCSTTIPMWCSTRSVHQVMRQKLLKICARKAEWSYPQTDDINCQLSTADITSNHGSNDSLDKCMEHSQIGSLSCIWRNYGHISILQTKTNCEVTAPLPAPCASVQGVEEKFIFFSRISSSISISIAE